MIESLLFAAVLAVTPISGAAADSARHPLRVAVVEGAPADSALRVEFMDGFDEALSAPTFPVDARSPGADGPQGLARPNRFERGEEGAGEERAWSLQVVVRAPPPYAAQRPRRSGHATTVVDPRLSASRGMLVVVIVTSPEDAERHATPEPERFAFAFPQSVAPAQVLGNVPQGFRFPWREAGRAAARLALEVLHHRSGDLGPNTRCDLSPAIRANPVR